MNFLFRPFCQPPTHDFGFVDFVSHSVRFDYLVGFEVDLAAQINEVGHQSVLFLVFLHVTPAFALLLSGAVCAACIDKSAMESGRLFVVFCDGAIGCAQVGPVDVGAQVFAADGAVGGLFDFNAALYRDAGSRPLRHGSGRNAKVIGQVALASYDLCGSLDLVHDAHFSAANDSLSIARLNLFRFSIA
jgi:hypothetical protein